MNATVALVNKFVTYVIDPLMLVLFACSFFLFMYGMVRFLWDMKEGRPDPQGKPHLLYGIIGMLIIVSVGGIINFLASTFGLDITGNSINPSSINSMTTGSFF